MAEPTAVELGLFRTQEGDLPTILPVFDEASMAAQGLQRVSSEEFEQFAKSQSGSFASNVFGGGGEKFDTLYDFLTQSQNATAQQFASFFGGGTAGESGLFEVDGELLTEGAAFRTPEQIASDEALLAQRQAEIAAGGASSQLTNQAIARRRAREAGEELSFGPSIAAQRGLEARGVEPLNLEQQADGTYSIVGVSGQVYETGLENVQAALTRQQELVSGSTPQVTGFFAPAVEEVAAKATLIDPATGEKVVVDVGSTEASKLLSEGYQLFSEEVGESLVVSDTDIETLSSDLLSEALTDVTTDADLQSLFSQLSAAQQLAIEALQPSEATLTLQEQLAEQSSIIEAFQQSFLEGIETIEGQPIPMQFIAGQQAALERQAGIQLQGLSRVQANLLDQLDISVSQDQANQLAAMTTVDFLMSNIDLAFAIEDRRIAEEQRVYERAMQLEDRARDTLTSILSSFEGQYWDNLSSDVKNELTTLANDAGISISLLEEAMNSVANSISTDITGADLASILGYNKIVTMDDGTQYGVNANGDLELIDVSNFVVPTAGSEAASGSTILGNGTITAYGSYEDDGTPIWPPGLDIQLDGMTDAAISLPYDFEITALVPEAQSGGFGNQVRGVFTSGPYQGQEVWLSHLDSFEASTGNWDAGTIIGFQGATGTTRGPTGVHVDITMPNENGSVEYNGKKYLSPTQVAKIFAPELMTSTGVSDEGAFSQEALTTAQAIMSGLSDLRVSDLPTDQRTEVGQALASLREEALASGDFTGVLRSTAGGKDLSDTQVNSLAKGFDTLAKIGDLIDSIEDVDTGPIQGIIASNNPYDTKAQLLNAQLTSIIPGLARGIYGEVGVLTDQDVALYARTLPNLKSTEEVNSLLTGAALRNVQRSMETQLQSMAAGGRDVSGYLAQYEQMAKQADEYLGLTPTIERIMFTQNGAARVRQDGSPISRAEARNVAIDAQTLLAEGNSAQDVISLVNEFLGL